MTLTRRFVALALVCLAGSFRIVSDAPRTFDPGPEDVAEERERWFFEQRAYPFGTIPVDGRRKAFDAVRRTRAAVASVAEPDDAPIWKPAGPLPVITSWPWRFATGRVTALAISPADPQIVLAGSSSGGIWRSSDGGSEFVAVSDDQVDLAVGALAFAPSNPTVAYAAMGNDFLGTGVLRSDDGGVHWTRVDGPTFRAPGTSPAIVVDPADWRRLWVAQWSRLERSTGNRFASGVWLSSDAGVTWIRQLAGLPSDLHGTATSGMLFAAMSRVDAPSSGPGGVYGTTNGGATWSLLFRPTQGTAPSTTTIGGAGSRLYAHSGVFEATTRYRLATSRDGGGTWSDVPGAGLPAEGSLFTVVDPSNPDVVYVGLRDLYKSTDGGQTFKNMTNGYAADGTFTPASSSTHVDQHAFVIDEADSQHVYIGNDGGVFASFDGAQSFVSCAGTLSLVQAYGIAAHPLDPARLYLGTQDNGLEIHGRNGLWSELITGDYGSIVFDTNDPETLAANYVRGRILSFIGGGVLFRDTIATDETFGEGTSHRIAFIAPFEHHRASNTLWFGTWRLFMSRDFGLTWSAPGGMTDLTSGGDDTLTAIGLCASNTSTIYTGSGQGTVSITRNGGSTWQNVTSGLPQRSVRSFAVDPVNAESAWVAFSGYAAPHVWRTTNGGATWQNASAGLPDIPVNTLFRDRNVLYAGTDIGVFRNTGGSWEYFSSGMPPVIVMDFDRTASGTIVAATHGRGVYELTTEPTTRRRSIRH